MIYIAADRGFGNCSGLQQLRIGNHAFVMRWADRLEIDTVMIGYNNCILYRCRRR